jgi:hypothetical protein
MKKIIIGILIFCCLLVSCYKPYDADIDANEKILVVDGMITNELASYSVRLSYAMPFYSGDAIEPIVLATVFVTDDLGNTYNFRKSSNGYFKSDPLNFTGIPGRTYTLYIETPEGFSYISDPQLLMPGYQPDTVYAIADYQQTISRFNEVYTTVRGANILINCRSVSDTLPHFRFTSNLLRLYNYINTRARSDYMLYCWDTENTLMDINLTQKEYANDVFSVSQQAVYFVDDKIFNYLWEYMLDTFPPYELLIPSQSELIPIAHRILYLDQYSINNETYLYYKSMDDLLSSEGKLFDPIAVQLRGNVHCTSNPGEKVFGFFEASSVSRTAYKIGFRTFNDQFSVTKIPYILPDEPDGCLVDTVPFFWVKH